MNIVSIKVNFVKTKTTAAHLYNCEAQIHSSAKVFHTIKAAEENHVPVDNPAAVIFKASSLGVTARCSSYVSML